MSYRISDLRNFVTAAEHRTISEAARMIGITQPALSQSLKRLEKDLQRTLLFRTRQGTALSPEGHALLPSAARLVTDLNALGGVHRPEIRIGAHSVIAAWAIPELIKNLRAAQIDFKFKITHGRSRDIQDQIQNGKIDLGLVVNPLNASGLVSKLVATDEFSVWVAKKAKDVRLLFCDGELVQTQHILRHWPHSAKAEIVQNSSLEFIVKMVRTGCGMGIVPRKSLERSDVSKMKQVVKAPIYMDRICLMYQTGFGRTVYERAFLDSVRAPD